MGACHLRLFSVTGSLEWDMKKEMRGIKKNILLNWFYWFDLFNWFVKISRDCLNLRRKLPNTINFEDFEISSNKSNQCNQLNQLNNLLFFDIFDLF